MEPTVREAMLSAVAKMPPAKSDSPEAAESEHGPQMLMEEDEQLQETLSPERLALRALATEIVHASRPVSLLAFKRHRPELEEMSDEAWLMFACLQLKGSGFRVEFVQDAIIEPFPINEQFYDVTARSAPVQLQVA